MRLRGLLLSGVASAMLASAAPRPRATAESCVAAGPSDGATAAEFQREATAIFRDVAADSRNALDSANTLESFADSPELSWQGHALELSELRTDVNDMGAKLCRLEAIRADVAPWQQKTIDEIAAEVRLMADNTQDAIRFVNAHQENLWEPEYHKYVSNLDDEARQLTRSVTSAVHYANAQRHYQRMREELGIGGS